MASYTADKLTERIIACIMQVHQILGPGFKEVVYRRSMSLEFALNGLRADSEKQGIIYYKGREVGLHRLDFLIEDQVVIELKCADALSKAHYSQLRSYLKASGSSVGLLVNMDGQKADIRRVEVRSPHPHNPLISL